MDREPSEHSQREQDADAGGTTRATPPQERYGPLALARHVKDDGRALLLYERARDPSA